MKYTSIRLQKSREPEPHASAVHFHMIKPASGGFHVRNVDGLGMPEINVNLAPAVDNRMASYNGSRSQNRQIVITATMYADYANNKSVGDLRDSIYRLAMPEATVGEYIRVDLMAPDGSIYLNTWGYISKIESPQFSKEPLMQITIECIPVHLRGHTAQVASSDNYTINLNNVGTAPTSVDMRIRVNSASKPVVFAIRRGDETIFRLQTSTPFQAGDVIHVNTAPDVRTVYLNRGTSATSLLRYVDPVSVWFEVPPGPSQLMAVGNTTPNPFIFESTSMLRQYWGA